MTNEFQFAPPAPSSGVCAKGGRRLSSLASAATQSTVDHEEYRSTDTALGRRWGMCRSTRALRTTGRFGGLGCMSFNYGWRHDAVSRPFFGIGSGCNRSLAIIHHRRKGVLKRSSERRPSHSQDLRFRDPKPTAARRPKSWFSLPIKRTAT